MKFLADMGISPKTVSFLNSLAHDAVHLKEQGLQRASDSFILEKALNEGRILLTGCATKLWVGQFFSPL